MPIALTSHAIERLRQRRIPRPEASGARPIGKWFLDSFHCKKEKHGTFYWAAIVKGIGFIYVLRKSDDKELKLITAYVANKKRKCDNKSLRKEKKRKFKGRNRGKKM